MNRIPLRPCTVADARWYYNNKLPIKYTAPQTYGGKDENGHVPSIKSFDNLDSIFLLDGHLKWEKDDKSGIIAYWLAQSTDGPYSTTDESPIFYYLGGLRYDGTEHYWMQICSGPLNVLSEDCMDEQNVWIPDIG